MQNKKGLFCIPSESDGECKCCLIRSSWIPSLEEAISVGIASGGGGVNKTKSTQFYRFANQHRMFVLHCLCVP